MLGAKVLIARIKLNSSLLIAGNTPGSLITKAIFEKVVLMSIAGAGED